MLTELQRRIARVVSGLPEAGDIALAGGGGLISHGIVDRATQDLDFFGTSIEAVDDLAAAAIRALRAEGLDVTIQQQTSGFVRLEVRAGHEATEVDIGADARIRPAEAGPLGAILTVEELAADKLLALFGRAQPRDFVDVAALEAHIDLERMCELASEKDPGFSVEVLREMLGSFSRLSPQDFDLDPEHHAELATTVSSWRNRLREPPSA